MATASWLDLYFIAPAPSVDIPFEAGRATTALTTFQRAGARAIDFERFPATHPRGTRKVRFKATIENALDSSVYSIEARLYDITHDVVIASSTLSNTAEDDRGVAIEGTSVPLTVGSAAGNLRSDDITVYEVQYRAVGTLSPPTDQVIISGARLEVTYE